MTSKQGSSATRREGVALYERIVRIRLVKSVLAIPVIERILIPTRGDRSVHKFIRYSMVSGVAVVISQATILLCTGVFGFSGILSNTLGAVASTPASYELNRKWAWGKSGKSHLWREVAPFWGFTLLGYLASTGTVQLADSMTRAHHVHGAPRIIAIMGASLFAYGLVWIVKFLVFNRIVFATRTTGADGKVGAEGGQPVGNAAGLFASGPVGEGGGGNGGGDNGAIAAEPKTGEAKTGQAKTGQDGSSAGEQLVPETRY